MCLKYLSDKDFDDEDDDEKEVIEVAKKSDYMKNIKFIKPTKSAKLPHWLFSLPKRCKDFLNKHLQEYCPHCGYYCTGKTVFCTKRHEYDTKDNRSK